MDRVREVVGIERAQPALFSLPAGGRLLVRSDSGVWVVQADGSKRLLGLYAEAVWSPLGRYVAAVRRNELAALEQDGNLRWALPRPGVHSPGWAGSDVDTRIAYGTSSGGRVVAGDGTGDRAACGRAGPSVAPALRPGTRFDVAVSGADGMLEVYRLRGCALLWRARTPLPVTKLEWSSDGRRLLALTRTGVRVFDERGHVVVRDDPSDATHDVDASFLPGTHRAVVIRFQRGGSAVFDLRTGRSLFGGSGRFSQVVGSPDGSRLLVAWPTADQWVFLHTSGRRRVTAVAGVSAQFGGGAFPEVEGWCCTR